MLSKESQTFVFARKVLDVFSTKYPLIIVQFYYLNHMILVMNMYV